MNIRFPIFILFLFLIGCAGVVATGPKFTLHELSKNNLYFYREATTNHKDGIPCQVFVDNKPVGVLNEEGYIAKHLNSGNHILMSNCSGENFSSPNEVLPITISANTKYFIKLDFYATMTKSDVAEDAARILINALTGSIGGGAAVTFTSHLESIPEAIALPKLKNLRQSI